MSTISAEHLVCASCGTTQNVRSAHATCPKCHGLLELVSPPPAVTGAQLARMFDERVDAPAMREAYTRSGVWRFRELVLHVPDAITHGEGNTPLMRSARVAKFAGVDRLALKHEGYNPTGSFKDRGMTVAVSQARRVNARAVACASTGNTSASLAAYAAIADIPALVLVPEGKVSPAKIGQTIAYGAKVLAVKGDFDDCMRLALQTGEQLGVYLANSVNPFRLAGQKTIIFELLQQLGWSAPDWIAVPAGNLGNTSAFGMALKQAYDVGLIDRVPRLLAVQSAGAAPFARGFTEGFKERRRVQAETVATAIRIGDPASWDRAVWSIRSTNGVVVAVSDADILAAKAEIDRAGIGCEPASAASVAGVKALRARGEIRADESVVAVLTGNLMKDTGTDSAASITSIDPTLAAIEAQLD